MASLITENLKARIPWFLKIPGKVALSRLPVRDKQWQKLNIFRAGAMDSPESALDIFKRHLKESGLTSLRECTVLELGPGNGLLTALYARSFGATRTWLIDAGPLASTDVRLFAEAERLLSTLNLPVPDAGRAPSIEIALGQLNTTYLTEGLTSLQTVPDEAVDYMFSNAVLEHIRLAEFAKTAKEMRRILKPSGVASHRIDFRDHLQNGLNNLRSVSKFEKASLWLAQASTLTDLIGRRWRNCFNRRVFPSKYDPSTPGLEVCRRLSASWRNPSRVCGPTN
jgi:SAM-dependent methyltransferase